MEVVEESVETLEGQMSVGEFRGDGAEFQELRVSSCKDQPQIWHLLAQSPPFPCDFCIHPPKNTGEHGMFCGGSHGGGMAQGLSIERHLDGGQGLGMVVHGVQPKLGARRDGPAQVSSA